MYEPKPIDLSGIELPETLMPLAEKIAENVHDEWAKTRIEQGWTWGRRKNDALQEHPCLVPYNELPEEERVYDRNIAISAIKLIIASGFKINKK